MGIKDREPKPQLKFSDGTKQLFIRAEASARSLNHNSIGTEHFLLASLQDPLISAFLKTFSDGDPEEIKNSVLLIVGQGERPVEGVCEFTPRAKHVIELALDEAKSQGKTQIEPSDIFLGLIREGEGVAAGILSQVVRMGYDVLPIKNRLETFSKNFKGQLSNREKVLSGRTESIIQRLRNKMSDPNLTDSRKACLLLALGDVINVAQPSLRKSQKNS